jgi:molybdopterin-guanine dinucleotide biosynthesis protein A
VRDFLKLIRARQVNFNAPTDPFLNINTPEDLAAATSHPVI